MRLYAETNRNVFSAMLGLDKKVARAAIKKIPLKATHLVVSQNLLPFLWEEGVCGGRTFDVLMTRLPMSKLHERLDIAHANFPESKTLNDFRAPQDLVELENAALTKARRIITPHSEIADIFNNKSIKLNWHLPKRNQSIRSKGDRILFPASSLGRKGAYELKQLALELNLTLAITGKAMEHEDFWNGIKTVAADVDPLNGISIVIYPPYIEHQPRILLKAIAAGIPVITTTSSGLSPAEGVTILPFGDYPALKKAVEQQLSIQKPAPHIHTQQFSEA